jgi:aldose 1-epimerase
MRWCAVAVLLASLTLQASPTLQASLTLHASVNAPPAAAPHYAARHTEDVVNLEDTGSHTVVSIAVPVGNIAFSMAVNGTNVLHWPYSSVDEFKARPALSGIPFLGPWANRLDEQAFYANGRKYAFDMELGNVRGAIPIHGFLTTNPHWQLVEARADGLSAWETARLDFYRQPLWMKQFPFAHTIEMTYRLRGGVLEVTTTIHNLSAEAMPVAIGFHPYFHLTDSPRDEWTASVGARTRWLLASTKVPTGQTQPIERLFPNPQTIALNDYDLDDVFSDLIRDGSGRAVMSVRGRTQKIDVLFGRNWRSAVVWAPKPTAAAPDRQFICFEPMAGITDAMNLDQKGLYNELQHIPPGGTWRESFWIRAAGF